MTAGGAQVAFVPGTGFDTISGTPTYYRPGRSISVDTFQITNNRERLREENLVEPVTSVEGNFEGRLGLTYTMSGDVHGNVRDIVFSDGGTAFTAGTAPTSRWFVGTEYVNTSFGTDIVELELRSCIPQSYTITYNQGTNTIRENLVLAFADVRLNTAFSPTTITGPSDGSDAPFHGMTLTIDGSTVNREQSMTLEFPEGMYRYQRESDRHPVSAVQGGVEPVLSSTVTYHTEDYLGLALSGGDTTATQPQDNLTNVTGSVAFDDDNGTIATYSFSQLGLDEWNGNALVDSEADFAGAATWTVDDGVSIA